MQIYPNQTLCKKLVKKNIVHIMYKTAKYKLLA
jgi:hypothetical protein